MKFKKEFINITKIFDYKYSVIIECVLLYNSNNKNINRYEI